MKNKLTLKLLILFFAFVSVSSCQAQASSTLFAKAFNSLDTPRIDNEIMIIDPMQPSVVVLYDHASGESLSLFSVVNGEMRTTWHLAQLPDFMTTIAPANLRVVTTGDGPVVLLHGCAAHLCGGNGLAGALAYVANQHRMYTAFASWSDSTNSVKIVYSSGDSTPLDEKKFLDNMLREEKYNP